MTNVFSPNDLIGAQLEGGWTIDSLARPGETGGNFSLGFIATGDSDGRRAFVKVANVLAALTHPDSVDVLFSITRAHIFERELVDACTVRGLSRVVRGYGHGQIVTGAGHNLPYILFELAEGDIRHALNRFDAASLAARLRLCHEAAVAVRQLHGAGIAHQDVKPSNMMVFEAFGAAVGSSKIGDLGRASERTRQAEHDKYVIAGDPIYAPPEQLYGVVHESFELRRIACDIYQLGSLCAFILGQLPMNARVWRYLHKDHHPGNWGGTYEEVSAYVRAAHNLGLIELEAELQTPLASQITALIGSLTDPSPHARGHRNTKTSADPYSLQQVVSEWDLLARRAQTLQGR